VSPSPTRECGPQRRRALRVTATIAAVLGAILVAPAPPTASALPPGFPDLNAFTAVDAASHVVRYPRGGAAVGFATPDGVECQWGILADPNAHTDIRCSGDIPGIPASVPDKGGAGCAQVAQSGGLVGSTYLYVFDRHGGYTCPPFPASLQVGEKITLSNITCVVAPGNVTACVDPVVNHGFVLQPSGSWVF
jgi:hypothetical protein